ncbi:MAG: hypothetical protein H0W64_11100 [Gammaproteobacteria bacterium]|nr:hypothetical protein [Gammaproteobacteria bacterium]
MHARNYTLDQLHAEVNELAQLLLKKRISSKSARQSNFDEVYGKNLKKPAFNFYSDTNPLETIKEIDKCFARSKGHRKITEAIMNIAYNTYFYIDENRAQTLLTMAIHSPIAREKYDHIPHGHKHHGFYHQDMLRIATCKEKFKALKINFDSFKKHELAAEEDEPSNLCWYLVRP